MSGNKKNNNSQPGVLSRISATFNRTRGSIGSVLSQHRKSDPRYFRINPGMPLSVDTKCKPYGGNKKTQRNKSNFRRNRYKNNRTRKVYKKRH
jgi:hypothetical protein